MRVFNKISKWYSKGQRIIKSTILCLRFPFLYPRNRFTGNHYDYWPIVNFHRKWWKHTEDSLMIHITTEKVPLMNYGEINDHFYYLKFDDKHLYICNNNNKVLRTIPIYTLGTGKIIRCGWKDKKIPYFIAEEGWKDREGAYHIATVVHAKWLQRIIKFLDWINDWPLQLFHCLPSYTELDAMEPGWRKAFGIQMCEEIREALLKHGFKALFRYRITQIKEKWGRLCWYDAISTEEIFAITMKYDRISSRTCVDCGKPATKISTGWICPYCDDCIGERNYTKI